MSNPTVSTRIHSWTDAPEEGRAADEWPFPTEYSKFLITGELADRVRERLGATEQSFGVTITEETVSGGYSEYTQENELFFTIECGPHIVRFDEYNPRVGYGATTPARLQAWLDES